MIGSRSTDLTIKQNLEFSSQFASKQSFSYSVLKENFTEFNQHVSHYEKLTEYDPSDGQGWTELGHSYQLNKEYFKSFNAYQQAVILTTDNPNADLWFGIGLLYYRCGHYEWAESSFKAVLQIDHRFHNRSATHYKLGRIYCRMGYHRRALMSLLDAQRDNWTYTLKRAKIILYAGKCYFKVGETRNALSMYRKALRINKLDVKVYYYIAITWLKLGKPFRARKYIRRSKRYSRTQDGVFLEGVCSYYLGNLDKAQRKLQKALNMEAENELILATLGVVCASSFQLDKAFKHFNKIREMNPMNYEAQFNIAVLYDQCIQPCQAVLAYNAAYTLNMRDNTAYSRRWVLESVGHNKDFPSYEIPSFEILLELFESPPVGQNEIPEIFLRFIDPQTMMKSWSMPPFSTAPYNMFGMPTKGGKQFKRNEEQPAVPVKKEIKKQEEKISVAPKAKQTSATKVVINKRPPAPPPQTDRQKEIRRKQVAQAAAKNKYFVRQANSEASVSEDDVNEAKDVEIGFMHQCEVPALGQISALDSNCVWEWNPSLINANAVTTFITRVRQMLTENRVPRPQDFNEQKACSILQAQNYDPKKALWLIEKHLRRNK